MSKQWVNNFVVFTFLVISTKMSCNASNSSRSDKWLVPQADGTFQYMDEKTAKSSQTNIVIQTKSIDTNVFFFLYTRKNQEERIRLNNTDSLQQSSFNRENPTRIIIHGWRSHLNSPVNTLIRDAYLTVGKFNIFIVDWSSIADTYNYVAARYNVNSVAYNVAEFIDFLQRDGNMNISDLIVIGHSLGAHVAGIAGQKIKIGKIPVIYGLDPAYPLFSYNDINDRLSTDDAGYVETIQTNAGMLGFKYPLGSTSFYPNWGIIQKGCTFDWNGLCSHRRSYKFFAESIISNNFIADVFCESLDKLLHKKCRVLMNQRIKMADINNKDKLKGIYYIKTNSKEPYGLA